MNILKEIINKADLNIELVWVPPGTFMMGSPESETNRWFEEKLHSVTFTKGLWIAKFPVTQALWTKIMGNNPSWFQAGKSVVPCGVNTDDYPVESVSWNDICNSGGFLEKLNAATGKMFRLPTEAEAEYARRAGTITKYYWGDQIDGDYCWYNRNSENSIHPVGQKRPNAWGLYDMGGGVYEWCSDWYDSNYYAVSPAEDPSGPASGTRRVLRGMGWNGVDVNFRSAYRCYYSPSDSYYSLGFRVVLDSICQ